MSYIEQMEEAEKRARVLERNGLVRQLSPLEQRYYHKSRWNIFRQSFFEQLGCGCFFGFIFGLIVAGVALIDRKDPWSAALVLFGATWLVFPIFYSFYNVWDARVQNEIIFLKEIIRNRPATKPLAIRHLNNGLRQIMIKKSLSNREHPQMDTVFISKN